MKLLKHSENSEKLTGYRAEDIHKWIDGFFDYENFSNFLIEGDKENYNPYEHRQYRHCSEALEDAYIEFKDKYSKEDIKQIFESHLKDDYDGYLPRREDFINGRFKEKYHESENYSKEETILQKDELNKYFKNQFYSNKKRISKPVSIKILFRIILPTFLTIILFAYLIFGIVIPKSHDNMFKIKQEMVKELTASAVSIIGQYTTISKNKLSIEESKKLAIEKIRTMRYGKNNSNYFWITDMTPKMIMHPINSELEGKDLSNYVEVESHKKLFVEFVNLVEKDGEGYLKYNWQRDAKHLKHIPKLSFVKAIPEWNWIIGTGIYLDDVESEIEKLTENTIYMSVLIFVILLFISSYIIIQSYKIEIIKQNAEAGLLESKNRYRALVEASNEGYILELKNKKIICNNTITRMLDYSVEDLSQVDIWDKLFPDTEINKKVKKHLKNIYLDETESKEFEAEIKSKRGKIINVIIATSRIFFQNENAHLITIRPIVNNINFNSFNVLNNPENILSEIQNSHSEGHIISMINQLPNYVRSMLNNEDSSAIRDLISNVFEVTVNKFIESTIKEIGEPPSEFIFISLGSHARNEMTIFSDQDNALIFKNRNKNIERDRIYFLKLADRVCFKLKNAGFTYCTGGVMARNPLWCLSEEEWNEQCSKKIKDTIPKNIIELNIIFDIYKLYGDSSIFTKLQDDMLSALEENPQFFNSFAIHCQTYQIPINILGGIKSKEYFGDKIINLKECLMPIVIFARIYALKHKIKDIRTIDRLKAINTCEIITKERLDEIIDAFNFLWYIRFYNQIICHSDLKKINDNLVVNKLTDNDQIELKKHLSNLTTLNSKISYDFLGGLV